MILNVIAKDKEVDDRWRGFERPVSSRNVANDVDDSTVDALCQAVNARTGEIAHRYYQLKARWMGSETIDWWDRNAPLPFQSSKKFSWVEAKDIVTNSYFDFNSNIGKIVKIVFEISVIHASVLK